MGDGDDDKQVEHHSEQGDGGQQGVENNGLGGGSQQLPSGGVEVGEAEGRTSRAIHRGGAVHAFACSQREAVELFARLSLF